MKEEAFYIMNVMFFIVTSNNLNSNQNITLVIQKDFFFTLLTCTICAHTKLVSKYKFSKVEVHSTRLEKKCVGLGKKITCECDVFTNTTILANDSSGNGANDNNNGGNLKELLF